MVKLDNQTPHELPDEAENVLQTMFIDYDQVTVKSRYEGGFSGSLVYLVRPTQHGKPELPSVVKIDYKERIQQEWNAFKTHIRYKLPSVAEVRGEPTYPSNSPCGGLWYPLVGDGTFAVVSLRQYYQEATPEKICSILEKRLFKSLETLWKQSSFHSDRQIQMSYDSVLPTNLTIEHSTVPTSRTLHHLTPQTALRQVYSSGDYIALTGFFIVRLERKHQGFLLDSTPYLPGSYRLSYYPVPDLSAYQVGQEVREELIGIVRETRFDQLRLYAERAVGAFVDLESAVLTLSGDQSLPNPLVALPRIMNHSFDVRIGAVHGDLNLENVLIEPESGNIYLIDFAQARQDHVLHDLLHLEMGFIAKLVPQALAQAQLPPEAICSFYKQLHCAVAHPEKAVPPRGLEKPFSVLLTIRRTAGHYLIESGNWREYYYGLVLYLLGTLRYDDMDRLPLVRWRPKEVVFWAAAALLDLLEAKEPCSQIVTDSVQSSNFDALPRERGAVASGETITTHFHAPVTGTVHSGSGDIHITNYDKESKSK